MGSGVSRFPESPTLSIRLTSVHYPTRTQLFSVSLRVAPPLGIPSIAGFLRTPCKNEVVGRKDKDLPNKSRVRSLG
jgi:hypothetical protein